MSEWYRSKDLFKDCLQDQYDSGVWAARLTSVQQSKRRTLVAPLKVEIYVSKTISSFPKRASRRKAMKVALFFVFLLVLHVTQSTPAYGQAWTGVLSPSRAIDWSHAGIPGGIPSGSWTQCGPTVAAYGTSSSPASPATIQTAINACGTKQYVQLGPGSFYLSGSFHIKGQANIEVRGMGANSTFIYFYGNTDPVSGDNCGGYYALVCIESADNNWVDGISNGPVNWTAGYSKGTTVITLASVPNLKIGNPIILDQLLDTTDTGTVFEQQATNGGNPFVAPGSPGPYSGQGGVVRTGRGLTHVYTVTGCNGSTAIGASCSGTNVAVTIDPPIEDPNWNAGLSPQAWWASGPSRNAGVQNFSIDGTNGGCTSGNGSGITFVNTVDVWQRGIRDGNECRNHTLVQFSARATIRDNYMFLARYSTSTSYGFECYGSSDLLIENNILQALAGALIGNEGCAANVFGYNFEINGYYTGSIDFVIPMANFHGVGNDTSLYEGNIGSRLDADAIHGTGNLSTMFRNRAAGINVECWVSGSQNNDYASYLSSVWGPCTQSVEVIEDDPFHRFYNVIGNVLGTTGTQTSYLNGVSPIYYIGNGYTDGKTGTVVPNDPTVVQTLYRWGNCDAVNGLSAADCQWNSSEVPTTGNLATSQQPYAQTAPSNHTLPPSFYYSSTPSWWPSSKAWPIIGPDVTGGNISGTGGLAYTNPAEDCYNSLSGSTSNGSGGPFPFDATTCYGSAATSGGVTPPAPPSNLNATVN